jgi:hypothetical protein
MRSRQGRAGLAPNQPRRLPQNNTILWCSRSSHNWKRKASAGRYCGAALPLLLLALISGIFMFLMRQTIIVMSRLIEYSQKNQVFNHYQRTGYKLL